MSQLPNGSSTSTTSLKFVIGGAITIVGMLLYTALAIWVPNDDAGQIRGAIIILITPISTALFISGAAEPIIAAFTHRTDKIIRQTNGLSDDERHRVAAEAAEAALAKHIASTQQSNSRRKVRKPRIVKSDN